MVFPVVVYRCGSWTIKKAERWRTDAFELWLLEKTLESPLDYKEIQPVHSKGDQPWDFIFFFFNTERVFFFFIPKIIYFVASIGVNAHFAI